MQQYEVVADEDSLRGRYLTFTVGGEVYGIELKFVNEIIGYQTVTPVPEVAPFVKGIINLRGRIIPVIDVSEKFGRPPTEIADRTCIVIVSLGDITAGLIVDAVSEVLYIKDEEIAEPPRLKMGNSDRYVTGIGKAGGGVQLLLDCRRLLDEEEMEELRAAEKGGREE